MRLYTELQIPKVLGVVVIIGVLLAAALDFPLRIFEARVWRSHGFRQVS